MDKTATVWIKMNDSQFQRKFNNMSTQLEGLSIKGMKLGAVMSGISIPVVAGLKKAYDGYKKQEAALANLRAGLESSAGVAKRSFAQITAAAAEMQQQSIFGDEEIIQNVQTQLLTFTNIAGAAFDKTSQMVLDVASKLEGAAASASTLKTTSIMLGKALNDPVANLGALGRSGIQFSEQQKDQIKILAESNRMFEAQALILAEIERQYGGAAAAIAKTQPDKQFWNDFGDMMEDFGKSFAKYIEPVYTHGRRVIAWIRELSPGIKDIITKIAMFTAVTGPLILGLSAAGFALATIMPFLVPIIAGIGTLIPIVGAAVGVFGFLKGVLSEINAEFQIADKFSALGEVLSPVIDKVKDFWSRWGIGFSEFDEIFKSMFIVVESFGTIFAKVIMAVGKINVAFYSSLWENARDTFGWIKDNWSALWENSFDLLVAWGKDVVNVAVEIGKQIWSALKGDGFDLSAITDQVAKNFKQALKDAGIEELELRNPFAESKDIFSGMVDGIKDVVTDMDGKIGKLAEASLDLDKAAENIEKAAEKQADANTDTAKVVKGGFVNMQKQMESALVRGSMAAYKAEAQQSMPAIDRTMRAAETSVKVQQNIVKEQKTSNTLLAKMQHKSTGTANNINTLEPVKVL